MDEAIIVLVIRPQEISCIIRYVTLGNLSEGFGVCESFARATTECSGVNM